MRVLQFECIGADVANWQRFLATHKLYTGGVDGHFGPLTRAATEDFQQEALLLVDGIVGKLTVTAAVPLGFQLAPKPSPDLSPAVETIVKMQIDADGAPNTYGPPGLPALDYELNAHVGARSTGAIVGYIVVRDPHNPHHRIPAIQGPHDPCPGYFISTTAFQDLRNRNKLDPRKYVDASKINYVVRGTLAEENGVHLGDIVAVHSLRHRTSVFGIVGDSGNESGAEGSLALLQVLGYPFTSGKTGSVDKAEIIIRYFPGSNPDQHFFQDQAQIDSEAASLGLRKDFSVHH
jgi:Putative peptidoglycan binding domain/Fungal chitosanase of glycosyl hydrolase group 75